MARITRRSRRARSIAAVVALGLITIGHGATAQNGGEINRFPTFPSAQAKLPNGEPGHFQNGLSLPGIGTRQIKYHGGPVMLGTTHAYAIWYGNWTSSATPALMTSFFSSIGGSPYFNINTTYKNATTPVSNAVSFGGSAFIGYDNGKTSLSDADIENQVAKTIAAGKLPNVTTNVATTPDPNGVYFLFTSGDVRASSGFLTLYCGWHDFATMGGVATKYSFVGDPSRNMSNCAGQTSVSPNSNVAGDAMVNIAAHELEEAVTDPLLNAWYDGGGYENADKCAWNFGTTQTLSNGAKYNMALRDGNKYYIQQNWLNVGKGSCALKYP